jgi:F-type H+-transporting ATPase subunit delta
MRVRTPVRTVALWRPSTVLCRSLATAATGPRAEKEIEVDNGKFKFKARIPAEIAPKQHQLRIGSDPAPPDVPDFPSYFTGPAGKASHALFDAALKANKLDAVKRSLALFAEAYAERREITISLLNPRMSVEDKLKYIEQIASSLGCDPITVAAISKLQSEKRVGKIKEVAANFNVLMSENRKERNAAIISAEPLTERQYEAIAAKMQNFVKAGEKLIISREIDSSLIGGFIVRVGNRGQDLSVAAQIKRMETHLKEFFSKNQEAVDKVLVQ